MLFIQRVTRRLVSHLSLGLETPLFLRFDDSLWLPLETYFFFFFKSFYGGKYAVRDSLSNS